MPQFPEKFLFTATTESEIFAPEDSVVPPSDSGENIGREEEELKEGTLVARDRAKWSLALAFEDLLSGTRDSWRGLDPALGQAAPLTTIQRGRTGLPTNYSTFCE